MSEYTNYFAVKSSSEQDVLNKLTVARIKSVVDADKTDFWFSSGYIRNGIYNWVTVSASANSGFDNGQFFYKDQFDNIGNLFDILVLFFQEEDLTNWNMKVKIENSIIEKQFVSDKETVFSENEKAHYSRCFDREFTSLKPLLQAGKSAGFLNFVGIPYMEMNDQDKLSPQLFNDKYSLLSDELND